MKTKNIIPVNKAIQEAIRLGFRTCFMHHKNRIHSASSGKEYSETEFAIVRSYPVNLGNGHNGLMEYIVLNSGTLGFLIEAVTEKKEFTEKVKENEYSY
ncbi:MAG: hypothetical protein ACXVC6_07390 [Bacteroidia bacterium]